MNFGVLLYLLLAHFIADFPLQLRSIVELRNSKDWRFSLLGNAVHAGVHLLVSLILVVYFLSLDMLLVILLISVIHGIADVIKSRVILAQPFRKHSIFIFLFDQVCHIISIFSVLCIVNRNPATWYVAETLKNKLTDFFSTAVLNVTYYQRLTFALVLLLIGLWGVGIFIRILFDNLSYKPYKRAINLGLELVNHHKISGATNGGFIIGFLERLFIIISIVLDMPLVIGFILATKSVARLKKLEDDKFAEIFIIGSFISFISAIFIGYMIKMLKILPY